MQDTVKFGREKDEPRYFYVDAVDERHGYWLGIAKSPAQAMHFYISARNCRLMETSAYIWELYEIDVMNFMAAAGDGRNATNELRDLNCWSSDVEIIGGEVRFSDLKCVK